MALLVVAGVVSLLLAVEHLGGLSLPGCGEGSPCATATGSAFGRVPGVNWPVSHVGVAFFAAMLVGWFRERKGLTRGYKSLALVGAAGSLYFLGVFAATDLFCRYCVVVHVANLAFVTLALWDRRASVGGTSPPWKAILLTFAAATALLGAAELTARRDAANRAEQKRDESTREIIRTSTQRSGTDRAATQPATTTTNASALAPQPTSKPFTGRYRIGPEIAPIRVVIISDYQCRACKEIETQMRSILHGRADISFSAKHFPQCTDCNPHLSRTMHPNACWAARAAEAAGILRGDDGFWPMHRALFDRGGSFTQAELRQMVASLGYDAAEFERTMTSPETLSRIRADADEAAALGLRQTPMIFINGVEFRGWEAPEGLKRTIDALTIVAPAPASAAQDRPAGAMEKLVGDWRAQPVAALPAGRGHSLGPADAAVSVVVYGDYQVEGFVKLDAAIRAELPGRPSVRYTVIHFPVNRDCNPVVPQSPNARTCWAAHALEAAAALGGEDAYWALHAWLLANPTQFTDEALQEAATGIGLDGGLLRQRIADPAVQARVRDDARSAAALGLKSIPALFINGRLAPYWEHDGRPIVGRLLDEAAQPR